MTKNGAIIAGVTLASVLAGPILILCFALIEAASEFPGPINIKTEELLLIPPLIIAAVCFGVILSFLPNLIGTLALDMLAERIELARAPVAWMIVGAALGGAFAVLVFDSDGAEPAIAAFSVTSALSAGLCRIFMYRDR